MQFAQSYILLHLLWLVLVLAGLFYWIFYSRKKRMSQFVEDHLLGEVAASFSLKRFRLKSIFLGCVFFFSVIALARPQWGYEWKEVKRQGLDILIAVDTSKSMLTQDVAPNRLERTKLAIKDLIKELKGDRVGLLAFSGEAFLMCPLTIDYGGFLLSLSDLNEYSIPRGGTNVGKSIEEAMKAYEKIQTRYKAFILVTDGENLEGEPIALAKKAKDRRIKIYTVGIGTQEGELVRVQNDQGQQEFLKDDQGNFVKSRLNEKLLQEIAYVTGGAYVRASGAQSGLDYLYENYLSKMEKREVDSKIEKRFHERFQVPLALAILCLVLESILTTRKKNV